MVYFAAQIDGASGMELRLSWLYLLSSGIFTVCLATTVCNESIADVEDLQGSLFSKHS